jgi:DNA-directed RNA polymerase specialized sigma24 family protein
MLSSTLTLHDVRDVESLCARVVERSGVELRSHERDDLMAYLVSECWVLSRRYEAGGIKFSTWATTTLKLRAIDWVRKERGRTRWQFTGRVHERKQPALLSLDNPDAGLAETIPARSGDPALDEDFEFRWMLDQLAKEAEAMGVEL